MSAACCSEGLNRVGPIDRGRPAGRSLAARPMRLVTLRGGRFHMGTNRSPLPQDGEAPARAVDVRPFAVDPYAVTNSWFSDFVAATGYVTEAERFGWSLVFRDFVADDIQPRFACHTPAWWRRIDGACWNNPEGPRSGIAGREHHPVVHVSWNDAVAFAHWAGGRLPTEAEWEFAAQGGLSGARFPWGEQEPDEAFRPCNIWPGDWDGDSPGSGPSQKEKGTVSVDAFAPNDFGVFNMVGNTWEWCADAFKVRSLSRVSKQRNAAAAAENQRVLKGGSYLCHRSYCYRYRIAARTGASPNSSTGHVGFRVVFDTERPNAGAG